MKKTILVPDMHCNHCVKRIEKAMEELGVKAEINLEQTTVILEGDGLLIKTAIDEIYDLGFTPQEI